ncbi:hypothetical protein Bcep18194_C7099 [Burkholderia lata]|uniref:Uncharacterized protein n=1 Tax=Burkholderia lata (strain ATCC 17760 / DSM 23089 / LMG 22485 / NCIMB 9086 / R18194 / 383) TaxID=482957 RepID=Q39N23_BURL3|nr:hypothetical protein Bcep18194_C7099 [Burkholderia lata]
MRAHRSSFGRRHVIKPVANANATAIAFDTVTRISGAVVNAGATALGDAISSAGDTLGRATRRHRTPQNTEPSRPGRSDDGARYAVHVPQRS